MDFENYKKKIKLYRNMHTGATFALLILNAVNIFNGVPEYGSFPWGVEVIIFLAIVMAYVLTFWLLRDRKCIKCGKWIKYLEYQQMKTFECPHCGNTQFADKPVEIWFKEEK